MSEDRTGDVMDPYARLERIERVLKLAKWAEHSEWAPCIEINQWLLLGDRAEAGSRRRFLPREKCPATRWLGIYAGIIVGGATPEEAAENLEREVFAAILDTIDARISEHEKEAKERRQAKEQIQEAMRGRW